ncbi:hypothetical protein K461DRAFT_107896 [Myriangium duriaei CBS 260.36]|uniref:Velvet domain-containing protein n=1 Tax=Myriangium duriaei CBS 260.36 TaxID=1168546 RepID=A0A9P4J468_9PEZI|nr:hypothetical protein K461DRAFT_107896 [Myriangium duriaei CBS 260.36]
MSGSHGRTASRTRGPVPVMIRHAEDYSPSPSSRTESSRSSSSSKGHSSHSSRSSSRRHSDRHSSGPSSKYGLTMLSAVPDMLPASYPFQPSVMATKRRSSSSSSHRSRSSGNLVAVATLVSAHHSMPVPQGVLRGSNLVASFAELPSDYRARLPSDLKATGLGYASFPNLTVASPGEYKLRISLLKLPSSSSRSRETETLVSIETGKFQVYNHPHFRG